MTKPADIIVVTTKPQSAQKTVFVGASNEAIESYYVIPGVGTIRQSLGTVFTIYSGCSKGAVIEPLQKQAAELGADAICGLKAQGDRNSGYLFMGTAVKLVR